MRKHPSCSVWIDRIRAGFASANFFNLLCFVGGLEAVADAGLGGDEGGAGGVWLDLAAQVADVYLQDVDIAFVAGAPNGEEDVAVGEDFSLVQDEELEQVVLGGGELHQFFAIVNLAQG